MQVIYIDSVFLLNALMDALVLLETAQLSGIPDRRGRFFFRYGSINRYYFMRDIVIISAVIIIKLVLFHFYYFSWYAI